MKLASFKTPKGASYGAVTDKGIVDLGKRIGNRYKDLLSFIRDGGMVEAKELLSQAPDDTESEVSWLPAIPSPGKIVCVGLNYEQHGVETGRDKTENPALVLPAGETRDRAAQPILRPA